MDNHTKLSIIQNSLFIFISKFIDTFGGILSVIILARFLNPEGFGLYAYIISIFLAVQPIINLELDKITIRELSTAEDRLRSIQNIRSLKTGMLVLFIVGFSLIMLYTDQPADIRASMFLCMISEIFIQYTLLNVSVLITLNKAVYDSYTNALAKFFFLAWILAGWLLEKDITFVFYGYLLSNFIRFVILSLFVRINLGRSRFRWNIKYFKYLIRECLPITVASFIIGLTFRIDIFIIKYFMGDAPVGLFYSIHKIILVIQIVPVSIINAFFPHMSFAAKKSEGYYLNMYKRIFDLLFFSATTIILFNLLFHSEIISILYGKGYEQAQPGFLLLIPVSLFLFLDYLNTISLTSLNRQKLLLYSGLSAFAINTAVDLVLVPRIGIAGACIGTFLSYMALGIISFICHPRFIIKNINYKENALNIIILIILFYIGTKLEGLVSRMLVMIIYMSFIYFIYDLREKIIYLVKIYRDR